MKETAVLVVIPVFLFLILSIMYGLVMPGVILEQGLAHRIFYFHVGVAWVAVYGPIFSSVFAILFLSTKNSKWDYLSYSGSLLSFIFSIPVIFSGRIWASSAWGVSWDKTDARLQSFLMLVICMAAYLIVRSLVSNPEKKRIISSYLSLLSALNAVLTWGAIRWIENPGNHPGSVLGKGGMSSDIRIAFWLGVSGFHVLFLYYFYIVYHLEKSKGIISRIKLESME